MNDLYLDWRIDRRGPEQREAEAEIKLQGELVEAVASDLSAAFPRRQEADIALALKEVGR